MNIALLKQAAADRLAGSALKQDVVRKDNRSTAIDREHTFDVLDEVQLFVAGCRGEVVPAVRDGFFLFLAVLPDYRYAGLLAEWLGSTAPSRSA